MRPGEGGLEMRDDSSSGWNSAGGGEGAKIKDCVDARRLCEDGWARIEKRV